MIHIEAITDFESLALLHGQWNAVLEKSAVDTPFLSFEWLSCWWQSYGGGGKLFVLIARENEEIIGIAPLMQTTIRHRGLKVKAITFIANYHSNRSGFMVIRNTTEVIAAMIDYLRVHQRNISLYLFDFMIKGSDNDVVLSHVLKTARMKSVVMASMKSPYITLDTNWDEFVKGVSKKFRAKLNNVRNSMTNKGGVTIAKYAQKDIDKAIDELLLVSAKTWQFTEGTAIASTEENRGFYRTFARVAADKGWLNIWILKVNEQPIAFMYFLIYAQKALALKIGYNEDYAHDSPGVFLCMNLIKDCFENNLAEYDWLGDNNPYKLQWTSLTRDQVKYLVFNNSAFGKLLYVLEYYIIPCIKKIFLFIGMLREKIHEKQGSPKNAHE